MILTKTTSSNREQLTLSQEDVQTLLRGNTLTLSSGDVCLSVTLAKPDYVIYTHIRKRSKYAAEIYINSENNWAIEGVPTYTAPPNAKLTFDGMTHELKNIEMVTTGESK